jgi:hypothetical protein
MQQRINDLCEIATFRKGLLRLMARFPQTTNKLLLRNTKTGNAVEPSVSFPGFPVPEFPGSRRYFHSRFPGKSARDFRE